MKSWRALILATVAFILAGHLQGCEEARKMRETPCPLETEMATMATATITVTTIITAMMTTTAMIMIIMTVDWYKINQDFYNKMPETAKREGALTFTSKLSSFISADSCFVQHVPDPAHHWHNDVHLATASAGLLTFSIVSIGLYNLRYGPWSKGSWFGKVQTTADEMSRSMQPSNPLHQLRRQ
ncbi:unnamed protein product [Symbiodinium sp. KB8]|nr:unnamed protein product [Symbiodinium sp. KB8]